MPKLASAKKRLRQSIKQGLRNRKRKEAYKGLKRKIQKSLKNKTGEKELSGLVNQFSKAVDKAASHGSLHRNKASREKSRLMKLIKKGGQVIFRKKAKPKAAKKTVKAKAGKAVPKKASSRKEK